MKILVFSDSHGKSKAISDNIRLHLNNDGVDHVFFLGDGLRDFLSVMEEFPDIPYNFVPGNCDYGIVIPNNVKDRMSLGPITVGNKKFLIMHGHMHEVKKTYQRAVDYAIDMGADILLFGHTHWAFDETLDGSFGGHVRAINPGSCGSSINPTYALINIVGGQVVCGFGQV